MLPLHWIPLILNRDRSRFIDKDPLILFAVEKGIICCLFYSLFFSEAEQFFVKPAV